MYHQVVEMARTCLGKSQDGLITADFFFDLSESMEMLLANVSITWIGDCFGCYCRQRDPQGESHWTPLCIIEGLSHLFKVTNEVYKV